MAFLVESCGEMMISSESHKPVPAPFLTKTYTLVDDPSTNHIVSWGEDDSTFVVWRPPEFARDVLPNYFKHNNFSSFVRQLNTYGFRKIVADRWEFANDFFRKGGRHLLAQIQRRKTNQQYMNSPTPFDSQEQRSCWSEPPLPPPGSDATTFISALFEDNERLRRNNSYLVSELTHLKKLYHDIISFIQTHVNPTPCRLLEFDPSTSQPDLQFSSTDSVNDTVKLFGVPLSGKKKTH